MQKSMGAGLEKGAERAGGGAEKNVGGWREERGAIGGGRGGGRKKRSVFCGAWRLEPRYR